MKADAIVMIVGGLLGIVVMGWLFFYLPMSANYAECGSVFLCR